MCMMKRKLIRWLLHVNHSCIFALCLIDESGARSSLFVIEMIIQKKLFCTFMFCSHVLLQQFPEGGL